MQVPPEITELCDKLRWKYGTVRHITKDFYVKSLEEEEEYHGCFLTFWNWAGMKTFIIYRKDRCPMPEEFLPFLQTLFDDGQIQELVKTEYSRHFVQGKNLYNVDSVAQVMANQLTEVADKKDEVEQFDLDKTGTGKRMWKHLRNGTH